MAFRNGRNIPIELLRAFVAIAEHGSITRAGEELNLTQPAISAQIKRLQALLGGDVFVKKGLGVGLSDLGMAVESYARRILSLNDQIISISGQGPTRETIHIGIQNVFARVVLEEVANRCGTSQNRRCHYFCSNVAVMSEKLKSGYVDLVFMLAYSESRLNMLAGWYEKLAWVGAPHQSALADGEPIPIVGWENGFIDRKVIEILDESEVPYRIVFNAGDTTALVAAVNAGMGFMITPERAVPHSLVVARDPVLPKLPELRAGVFCKEGFDLRRNKSLVEAFLSAVQPPNTKLLQVAR